MSLSVSKPNSSFFTRRFYARLFSKPNRFLISIALLSISNTFYQLNYNDWSVLFEATLWNPTWLLMGPLLLLVRNDYEERRFNRTTTILHLLPFLFVTLFFIIANLNRVFNTDLADKLYHVYQYTYVLLPLSLLLYASLIFYKLKNKMGELAPFEDLLLVLSGFYVLIAGVSAHLYICWGIWKVEMVIDYRIFIYALSLSMVAFIFIYLNTREKLKSEAKKVSIETIETPVVVNLLQLNEYERKLQVYLVDGRAFLNPDLSLAMLSKELQIPKYHLSILFNQHLGQSFYSHLAMHRVEFATHELLQKDYNLTLEALAYKCGFNSKTCFHKYFREYKGLTPSAFINQQRKAS